MPSEILPLINDSMTDKYSFDSYKMEPSLKSGLCRKHRIFGSFQDYGSKILDDLALNRMI